MSGKDQTSNIVTVEINGHHGDVSSMIDIEQASTGVRVTFRGALAEALQLAGAESNAVVVVWNG